METLRYPIGKFSFPKSSSTSQERRPWIDDIGAAPAKMSAAVAGLTAEQLDTPYRPEGWTVRRLVHHVPDSHLNAYTRFKLALTEDEPTIKPYDEAAWAQLADTATTPVEVSLAMLQALHQRWVCLLESLSDQQFARQYRHPAIGIMRLDHTLAMYAWHSRHHVAHITALRERMAWA
ncbi:MAG: YfiT family bacillithiol transferase [Bryobacteraceae bacterium]|jgi:uncharacterized damage-inducible protein DinB